jgi:DNA-binding FadR family transcriptional regulator
MLGQRGELRESAREHRDMRETIGRQDADAVTAVATHHLEDTRGIWAGIAETAGQ